MTCVVDATTVAVLTTQLLNCNSLSLTSDYWLWNYLLIIIMMYLACKPKAWPDPCGIYFLVCIKITKYHSEAQCMHVYFNNMVIATYFSDNHLSVLSTTDNYN